MTTKKTSKSRILVIQPSTRVPWSPSGIMRAKSVKPKRSARNRNDWERDANQARNRKEALECLRNQKHRIFEQ
jgi:hypothetical protein